MELLSEAGRQVGTAANPTTSFAGFLDGEMDSKGMCSPLYVQGQGVGRPPPTSASSPALLASSPTLSWPVFLFLVPAIEENLLGDKHLLKPWDAKKVGVAHSPSSFHGEVFQCPPLSTVFIFPLLPFLLSCPHPPDLGPVKSLELSKYLYKVG